MIALDPEIGFQALGPWDGGVEMSELELWDGC